MNASNPSKELAIASPTGYPDEEIFTVTLVGFDTASRVSVMRILRDSGMVLSEVQKITSDLPQMLWDDYVPSENPLRDIAIDALREFGQAEFEFTRWGSST